MDQETKTKLLAGVISGGIISGGSLAIGAFQYKRKIRKLEKWELEKLRHLYFTYNRLIDIVSKDDCTVDDVKLFLDEEIKFVDIISDKPPV